MEKKEKEIQGSWDLKYKNEIKDRDVTPKRGPLSMWGWPLDQCKQNKKNKRKDEGERWKKPVEVEGTDGGKFRGREEIETKKTQEGEKTRQIRK